MPKIGRRLRPIALLLPLLLVIVASSPAAGSTFPPGGAGFHTYAAATAELKAIAAAHPDIVALHPYGQSAQGRTLWAVKVSDHVAIDEAEPEVLVLGLTHGNEHLSLEQALALIHWLVDGYGHDSLVTRLVNTREIWVLPMVNPDGAEFDISGARYHEWRKNRQPTPGTSAIGTDINRNFSYRWGCCGNTSANPSSGFFRGPAAFSAPESAALRDFVLSRRVGGAQQIRIAVSLHTFGKVFLYPYGYTTQAVPSDMRARDHRAFVALGKGVAARDGYKAEQGSAFELDSGGFVDWAYGTQRILAFTMELGGGDYPAASRIGPLTQVNRSAFLYLIDQAACPYRASGEPSKCALLPPLHAGG